MCDCPNWLGGFIEYTRNTYKLTWLLDEGSSLEEAYKTEELKFEKPIEKPIDPTKDGYTFDVGIIKKET